MSNKFSSKESNRIKNERDFSSDGVLQYDLQQNPALVRRIRIPIFKPDGNPYTIQSLYPIYFPFKALFVLAEGDIGLTLNLIVNDESTNNDAVPLKPNDVINFDRKVAQAFCYIEIDNGGVVYQNDYLDVLVFTDANFESGKKLNINSGAQSTNLFGISSDTYDIVDSPISIAANYERKVLNIYCDKDVQLSTLTNDLLTTVLLTLKAGYYSWEVSGGYSIEILSDATVVQVSEEI